MSIDFDSLTSVNARFYWNRKLISTLFCVTPETIKLCYTRLFVCNNVKNLLNYIIHALCDFIVNGEYITACNHDDAVNILRNAGDIVVLTVKHYRAAKPFLQKNGTATLFIITIITNGNKNLHSWQNFLYIDI